MLFYLKIICLTYLIINLLWDRPIWNGTSRKNVISFKYGLFSCLENFSVFFIVPGASIIVIFHGFIVIGAVINSSVKIVAV